MTLKTVTVTLIPEQDCTIDNILNLAVDKVNKRVSDLMSYEILTVGQKTAKVVLFY